MRAVFIGGCGRSGTTLLGALLGSHSRCVATPESQFKIRLRSELAGPDLDLASKIELLEGRRRFRHWGIELGSDWQVEPADDQLSSFLYWVVSRYAHRYRKTRVAVWVDHTPSNIKYLKTLFEEFPDAKAIHVVRDPRAVVASILPLDWGPNTAGRAAKWWIRNLSFGLAAEAHFSPDRIRRVHFEQLVGNPEKTLRQLCTFVGVDFEPSMVEGSGFEVPDTTRQQHLLVGQRPRASQADAWQERLDSRAIEIVESHCAELLPYLGYQPIFGMTARPTSWWEKWKAGIRELVLALGFNKIRHESRLG